MGFITAISGGVENNLEGGRSHGGKTSKEATATGAQGRVEAAGRNLGMGFQGIKMVFQTTGPGELTERG